MKNILAISYMLPPLLYPQSIQISRILANLDHNVFAVSGYNDFDPIDNTLFPDFNQKIFKRIEVPYDKIFPKLIDKALNKYVSIYGKMPDQYIWWVNKAKREIIKNANFNIDLIVSFGQPMSDHLLGLKLKKHFNIPWVVHFSDPWVDNPFRTDKFYVKLINKELERRVIYYSDKIIFCSEETLSLVMDKYPKDQLNKATVIPHSFDESLFLPDGNFNDKSFVVRHIGNFYGPRSPLPIFKALNLIKDSEPSLLNNVCFEFIGHMPSKIKSGSFLAGFPKGLIKISSPVGYLVSLKYMTTADLLLLIDAPAEISVFLPSKLIDYLGSQKPIFAVTPKNGASSKLIKEMGGKVEEPQDIQGIANSLKEILANKNSLKQSYTWGNEHIRAKYSINNIKAMFNNTIKELL